ncbi:MAG: NAD-dependent epimerase/dehydratase family protein [Sulfuricurvum sp.]|jgi:UDP-glucose 4-epimerase|nr:NAD-dependent epimerase/dehydratase family protein [Sulfuricurvum sp.]
MKIMVVGGAGFIGSHLADGLVKAGHAVSVVDNLFLGKRENLPDTVEFYKVDASLYHRMYAAIIAVKPDVIFNLAVLPLPHSLVDPYRNVEANIRIVNNLCCLLQQGKYYGRLIHFSSSEVYGSAQYEPMCEKHPIEPSTPYAASKAAGDFICSSYIKTFGCDITIIRPFNNYGERQNGGSYAGVIPLTIQRLREGKVPIIYGSGKQTRDYIYVGDTVRAAQMVLGRDDLGGQIFNIASGHDVSIGWIIQEIQELMGTDEKVLYQPERAGDVRRHIANTLRAKDILHFEHKIGMKEGLKKTIDWYLAQK